MHKRRPLSRSHAVAPPKACGYVVLARVPMSSRANGSKRPPAVSMMAVLNVLTVLYGRLHHVFAPEESLAEQTYQFDGPDRLFAGGFFIPR